MNEVAALLDRQPPVVVDHQLAAVLGADRLGRADLGSERCLVPVVLDAQLHQLDPKRHQPCQPVAAADDQVERIEPHEKTAWPITGVDGTAMSRGSSQPAAKAAWPASTAWAKAPAIATGSFALATAVLSSTAS
jgi:hypothetical protein